MLNERHLLIFRKEKKLINKMGKILKQIYNQS